MELLISFSRNADADLISFFKQQDRPAASLIVAALCAYLENIPISFPLNPVTIMGQEKRYKVHISYKKRTTPERVKRIEMIQSYLDEVPAGMVPLFVKGIVRSTYGSVIYRNQPYTYVPPVQVAAYANKTKEEQEEFIQTDTGDTDDIFDLFESLLD